MEGHLWEVVVLPFSKVEASQSTALLLADLRGLALCGVLLMFALTNCSSAPSRELLLRVLPKCHCAKMIFALTGSELILRCCADFRH